MKDVRHRWNTVDYSISTAVHSGPQIDVFLLHKHICEAIIVVTHRSIVAVSRHVERRGKPHLLLLHLLCIVLHL